MVRPFDARNGLSSEILQPEMDPRCQLVDTVHWVCRFLGQSCSLLTYHFNRDIAEGVRGTGSERAKVPEALSRLMGDETSNAIRNVFPSLCVCVCVCVCVYEGDKLLRAFEEFSSPTGRNAHSRSSVSNTPWDLQHGRRPLSSNAVTHWDLFPCAFFFSTALQAAMQR